MINILLIFISLMIILIILIQNPVGSNINNNFKTYSNRFMSIQNTNNVLNNITLFLILLMIIISLYTNYYLL